MGEIRIKRDVSDAIVYGFHVDPNVQDPSNAVTYLEDAIGMTPASMESTSFNAGSWADAFFIPNPCMVRYDGTVDYYLDPSDYSKKADGTASDIADPNYAGNAMMEWGLIWFKFEPGEADGEGYFYVSNKKVNDSFNCWCNYDANNNINPHFYTAIYNGTGTDKLRSMSGVQLTPANGSGNTTGQQEITRAMANNVSDLTEWYIDLWADRVLLTGLLYLMGKSLNLQATFGRGLDSGGYTAKNAYVTGTLNDKGLFWGDTINGDSAVKVFGMENFWGCCWHRTAGLFGTSTGYAYKLTHGTVDGSTATEFDTEVSGYISINTAKPETGFVTKMLFGKQGMLPSAVGGSTSTYYCDYFIKGNNFAMVGGNTNYGLYCGFYVALHQSADISDWSISASLSLKPRAKVPYNPDWDNLPAHQFVNGQWVDIPTHHYTNGRWQGELTSQSPLKFWADGQMLDWRIEGKTSPEPETIVYGFHVDPSVQDPSNAVTYLEDAVNMTPASMGSTSFNAGSWADAFFMPKPCMVRYDGTVDYYLDPSDYSKKADGTASDIADPNYGGNAMMEWGLIWFKFEAGEADGEGYFYVSNKKVNDSFNCWCNYDANNNITQHFYTAIYNGTGTDKLRSISGVQLTSANGSGNTTGQQEISRAMANNTSDLTEWYIDLWADEVLSTGLLYLIGKSLNLQATFGRGLDSGGQTAKESYVTGTLNDKGLFWGDTTSGSNAIKVFGMENHWGCCYHRTAGLFGTSTGYAYKLTHGTVDGSTATSFGTNTNGYIPITATQPENGYVTKMLFGKYGILPTTIGGSTSTYYSDYFFKGTGFSLVGGNSGHGPGCGFSVSLNFGVGGANWSVSTSLSLKPRAKTHYNPHNGVGDWDETTPLYKIPVRVEGENLYTIPIGEDLWGDNVSASHRNNNGELIVVMGTGNDSGVYSRAGSTIGAKHNEVSNGSWSVEIKADSPMNLRMGFQADGAKYIDITTEYQKFTFDNQSFTYGSSFIIYNRTGVTNTVYLKNFEIYFDNTVNLYTDHQLMDGDSIDFTTDQTAIPIATGNNVLTVDTAVQPSKVFVKFEG